MSHPHYAYLFEAKGIQRYILDSGPLRDLVGASDLVDGLARSGGGDLLEEVLNALPSEQRAAIQISRRASGAFMAHAQSRAPLEALRGLWRLAASLRCPGLEMSDVLLTDEQAHECETPMKALKLAYDKGSTVRFNTAAELPPTGHPFTAFNPRTGRLTTAFYHYRDDDEGDLVPVDVMTETHRRRAQSLIGRIDGLAAKFLPLDPDTGQPKTMDAAGRPYAFPRNLDPLEGDSFDNPEFPFRLRGPPATDDLDRRIAVVHADLSGLAQAFRTITNTAQKIAAVKHAADAIEAMICKAARAASAGWIVPFARKVDGRDNDHRPQAVLPARPVVLGGDDITVIIRADLALLFTRDLLAAIEAEGRVLVSDKILKKPLSACAGIALVKAGQPFLMASALAESLCKSAKDAAKSGRSPPYPSFLAFHNAQSTLRESYGEIRRRELTAPGDVRLTANPYVLGRSSGSAQGVDDLIDLADALARTAGTGKLIEAARMLLAGRAGKASESWARWRDVLGGRDASALSEVDRILATAGFIVDPAQPGHSWPHVAGMVSDALDWIDFHLTVALNDSHKPPETAT